LKFREIADVLEVPEGTVKSRMAEALTILNQNLKKRLSDEPCVRPIGNATIAKNAPQLFGKKPALRTTQKEVLV
jgi:hypothetical protein